MSKAKNRRAGRQRDSCKVSELTASQFSRLVITESRPRSPCQNRLLLWFQVSCADRLRDTRLLRKVSRRCERELDHGRRLGCCREKNLSALGPVDVQLRLAEAFFDRRLDLDRIGWWLSAKPACAGNAGKSTCLRPSLFRRPSNERFSHDDGS